MRLSAVQIFGLPIRFILALVAAPFFILVIIVVASIHPEDSNFKEDFRNFYMWAWDGLTSRERRWKALDIESSLD